MKILPAINRVNSISNREILGTGNDHLVVKSKIKGKVIKILHQNSPIVLQKLSIDKKISNLKEISDQINNLFPELYLNTRIFVTSNGYLILQDEIKGEELSLSNISRITKINIIRLIKLIIFFDGEIDLFGIGGYYAFITYMKSYNVKYFYIR